MKKFRQMLIIVMLIGTFLSQFALTACVGGRSQSHIYDFYQEYRFDLPFAHSRTFMTSSLFFDTEYDMSQLRDLIIEAGYGARLYDFNSIERLHIYAMRDGRRYYFMITRLMDSTRRFSIDSSTGMISAGENSGGIFVFLFPKHLIDAVNLWAVENSHRMHGTFEEIAAFYANTGRGNVTINYEEKTIIYLCREVSNLNWNGGYVIMRWVETETGNYLDISPL